MNLLQTVQATVDKWTPKLQQNKTRFEEYPRMLEQAVGELLFLLRQTCQAIDQLESQLEELREECQEPERYWHN